MVGGKAEELGKHPEDFPFNESELSSGSDRVRGLYVSEGYLDVVVEPPQIERSRDRTRAVVTVSIHEGQRYTFGAISFDGETLYPREELITAAGELGASVGSPYSATQVTNMTRNLQSYLKAHGYYTAEVTVTADPKSATAGRVPVAFHLKPGPVYSFDGVQVTNNSPRPRLRAGFLPKRFESLRGQRYDPSKLDEIYRELLRTGLFTTLRPNLVAQPDHTLRLDVTAEEAKAREIGFTLGFSSYEGGATGLRLGDRNFLGNGRPLTFAFDYSQRGLRGELLYVDPWLFDTRYTLRARLYSTSREETGYKKNGFGARLDVGRKVLPHLEVAAFVEEESAEIKSIGIDPLLIGPLELHTHFDRSDTDHRFSGQ